MYLYIKIYKNIYIINDYFATTCDDTDIVLNTLSVYINIY